MFGEVVRRGSYQHRITWSLSTFLAWEIVIMVATPQRLNLTAEAG